MLFLLALAAAVAAVPVLSGRLSRLKQLDLRQPEVAAFALWLHIPLVTFGSTWLSGGVSAVVRLLIIGSIVWFGWMNRSSVGVPTTAAGAGLYMVSLIAGDLGAGGPLPVIGWLGALMAVAGWTQFVHYAAASKLYRTHHVNVTVAEFMERFDERNRALEAAGESVFI